MQLHSNVVHAPMTSYNVFSAMAHRDEDSLETLLVKATHCSNKEENWEKIVAFCDRINKELDGPQIATKLLLTRIGFSSEWEALQALTVLQACMKNCGRLFHTEVTSHASLDYLFQLISPTSNKFQTPERVKRRIAEMVCSWWAAFPNEKHLRDLHKSIKILGIWTPDMEQTGDWTPIPFFPSRPKHPVFDNNGMDKLLSELLQSKDPGDLQEANRLIKTLVREDDARAQKATKRLQTLEEVNINVKLLTEMLSHYDKDRSSDADKEILKEIYERCDKLRSTAFLLATETEDNDLSLGDILHASDDLSRVIHFYKKVVDGQQRSRDCEGAPSTGDTTETLIDLSGLDAPALPPPLSSVSVHGSDAVTPIPAWAPPPPSHPVGSELRQRRRPGHPSLDKTATSVSLLDSELLSLGLNDPPTSEQNNNQLKHELNEIYNELQAPPRRMSASSAGTAAPPTENASTHSLQSLQDLAKRGFSDSWGLHCQLAAKEGTVAPTLVSGQVSSFSSFLHSATPTSPALSLSKAQEQGLARSSPIFGSVSLCTTRPQSSPSKGAILSLSNVHVPVETVRPSKVLPVTAYDKDGVRVLLNFASDCPPGRPDVLVMVVTTVNTAPLPVQNMLLQAALPRSMKVKLQPPSGTDLAPFNPVLPPAFITQIILLANPTKEKVRLRLKFTFTLGERLYDDIVEVDRFPPPETWGHL